MRHTTLQGSLVLGILMLVLLSQDYVFGAGRLLDCVSTFSATSSHEILRERFRNLRVESTELHEGEGFYEQGSVIHGGPGLGRVEIFWKNVKRQQNPKVVRIRGKKSAWKTTNGLSLGQTLHEVGALNGKAFTMQGFAYDYGGTQTSWSGGDLEPPLSSACETHVLFSLNQFPKNKKELDVLGDKEFSSANPTIQQLNPRVSEIWLSYEK